MNVTLIGYRGSGKSSVAPLLAARLGWNWVDADVELEARAGRTIREIFAADGEGHFRDLERDLLRELLERDRLVIAAGGGAIMNPLTRQRMRAAGPVIWLQGDAATLRQRIAADGTTAARRPTLTGKGVVDEIEELLRQREPLYRECATAAYQTGQLTVPEIVEQIVENWPRLSGSQKEY